MSLSVLLLVWKAAPATVTIGLFIVAELVAMICLLINIKNSLLRLDKRYVLTEAFFYVAFWFCVILALAKRMQFIFAMLPLMARFFVKLRTYCKCNEHAGENDLEIFFKVIVTEALQNNRSDSLSNFNGRHLPATQ